MGDNKQIFQIYCLVKQKEKKVNQVCLHDVELRC